MMLLSHHYFIPRIVHWLSFEDKVNYAATGVWAESEAECFELLANHGCPNYRGSAKFPRCDRSTIWKDFGQIEVEGFGAKRYVIVSSSYR